MSRAIFVFPLFALVPIVTLLAARCCGGKRRSHFRLRVVILCLSMPTVAAILIGLILLLQLPGSAAVLLLLLVLLDFAALMFVEPILFSTSDFSSGGSGDGWGHGPGEPPSGSDRPSGELPSVDSEAGRWRLRDHTLPGVGDARSRRPAREPERVPAR